MIPDERLAEMEAVARKTPLTSEASLSLIAALREARAALADQRAISEGWIKSAMRAEAQRDAAYALLASDFITAAIDALLNPQAAPAPPP